MDALGIVREISRRAGHEIRNALNGVAVNVEVVRSRTAAAGGGEVASFAERAALQAGLASGLVDGLLALVGSVLAAEAEGRLGWASTADGRGQIEMAVSGDRGAAIVSDIKRLADRVGVGIEHRPESVILTVFPEGRSHPKE